MEAKIQFTNEEVEKMCEERCTNLFLTPTGKRWVAKTSPYVGVKCELTDLDIDSSSIEIPYHIEHSDNPSNGVVAAAEVEF